MYLEIHREGRFMSLPDGDLAGTPGWRTLEVIPERSQIIVFRQRVAATDIVKRWTQSDDWSYLKSFAPYLLRPIVDMVGEGRQWRVLSRELHEVTLSVGGGPKLEIVAKGRQLLFCSDQGFIVSGLVLQELELTVDGWLQLAQACGRRAKDIVETGYLDVPFPTSAPLGTPDLVPLTMMACRGGTEEDRREILARLTSLSGGVASRPIAPRHVLERGEHDTWAVGTSAYGHVVMAMDGADDDYLERTFPWEGRSIFVLLVCLVLEQRWLLMDLFDAASSLGADPNWGADDTNMSLKDLREFRDAQTTLRRRLTRVTASAVFSQISSREGSQRLYELFRAGSSITAIHREVRERLSELQEVTGLLYADERARADGNLQRSIWRLTLILAIPSVVFGALGLNINEITVRSNGLNPALWSVLLIALLVVLLAAFLIRHRPRD